MQGNNYLVKPVNLKNSETGESVGFTAAVFNDAGFVQASAYFGVEMHAISDHVLSSTAEKAMERYESASLPRADLLRASSLPYKSLLKSGNG